MDIDFGQINTQFSETQLEIIRELMLASSRRDEWLTLGEIALQTEFGEASISAQLRHLRKPQHGRYRVEKRRREVSASKMFAETCPSAAGGLWEYQVLSTEPGKQQEIPRRDYETHSAQASDEVKHRPTAEMAQLI